MIKTIFIYSLGIWLIFGLINAIIWWKKGISEKSINRMRREIKDIIGGRASYLSREHIITGHYLDRFFAGIYGFIKDLKNLQWVRQ
jgi:hypothetical protein